MLVWVVKILPHQIEARTSLWWCDQEASRTALDPLRSVCTIDPVDTSHKCSDQSAEQDSMRVPFKGENDNRYTLDVCAK